jgi:membrane protein DedA with SNARE-associated domain
MRRRKNGEAKIAQARAFAKRWGGAGIFFTRWLVTPLGPWLNLTSGIANYPWGAFLIWDVLGETLWVVLYVLLGKLFSGRVQALLDILGNLSWVIVGLIAAVILAWQLLRSLRSTENPNRMKAIPRRLS